MIQKDHECLHLLAIQNTLVRYSLNTLDSLWTNGAESYRENVLDSAKTLSGLFSGYLTYILVVTSGGRDGYSVQNRTNSSNVSSPLAFPVVLIFITNNTRQL